MADKNNKGKGSKAGTLFFLLIVAVAGAGAVGYFYPDTPVVGPLVGKIMKKAASGQDQSGVYKVTVKKLVLDPQEFDEGESVDLQLVIKRIDGEGAETKVWDSTETGENLREVGDKELSVNWEETPFEIEWTHGDQVIIEVWDRKGLSDARVARFNSSADSKEFPLKSTRSLTVMEGDRAVSERKGGTNQVVFESERIGDIPTEEESSE